MYESLIRTIVQEEIRSIMTDEALFRKRHVHGDDEDIPGDEDIVVDQCDTCDGYHIQGACPMSGTDHSKDDSSNSSHRGSYMAKPQMFQISREANSIYDMLNDDEQLDDWMESKIAQVSRDISSIYDSLSYKNNR